MIVHFAWAIGFIREAFRGRTLFAVPRRAVPAVAR
jgi:hypothetical protein